MDLVRRISFFFLISWSRKRKDEAGQSICENMSLGAAGLAIPAFSILCLPGHALPRGARSHDAIPAKSGLDPTLSPLSR